MFWNDPNLYGMKDIPPVQTPFFGQTPFVTQPFMKQIPWQNIPRYLPPTYFGIMPQFTPPVLPFYGMTGIHPYVNPYELNLPLQNFYRPFVY